MSGVAVLGAGNMGTALGQVIASNGHDVRAWSIETDVLEEIRDHRRNTKYLDGVLLHGALRAVWELPEAISGAELLIVSVPSQVVRAVAREMAPHVRPGQLVLSVAKGLEANSHLRMSQVLEQELGQAFGKSIGSMGGPAIAIEMARGVPMAVVIGMGDDEACRRVQAIARNEHLKVEMTTDVCGLELCSTLKNIYAIPLGMCDGLRYGTNTKAFLASLALEEMCLICTALGGERATVYGLAGLGDLLTTGFSQHSRNRTLGEKLGAGDDWRVFLGTHTVEGVSACRAIHQLVEGKGLNVHLLETVHEVLFADRPAPEALRHFFREFTYG